MVGADIPEDSLSSAAFGLGLNLSATPRIGVVRAALALFHGQSRDAAREYAQSSRKSKLGSDGKDFVAGKVPEVLADTGDTERAFAIRVGLAMAAGLTRKQAESWARMQRGRPRKTSQAA